MATFTITTAQNIDELTSKTGGDTYNVNGGTLTIDQDSRGGLNSSSTSTIGPMTLSATLGGTVEIDARKVRLIPYNSGSGNVPAWNTVISQGGASGKLIGVYSALNVASTATGAAMPASGWIKVKQWNDVAFSSGSLTGIGASATGADVVGWIELVGDEAGTCTVSRLNLFRVRGEWFDLGTTSGSRATTYQIPTNGVSQYHGGVWVETAVASGEYEFYPCAGTRTALVANIATDAVRGKWCWIGTDGLLRFGHDGSNSTGGYLPESGLKIRMPNVFFANAATASRNLNALPNATLATRYEFATTGGGKLEINYASMSWYLNISQAYSIDVSNTAVCTAIVLSEIASPITWSQVGVGQEAANSQIAFTLNLSFAGGTFTDCTFTRAAQASSGHYVTSMTDDSGFTFTRTRIHSLTKGANASTGSGTLTRVSSSNFYNTTLGGGRLLMTTCSSVLVKDTVYYDHPSLHTQSAIPMYAFDIATVCTDIKFDGLTFGGLSLVQPYSGILNIGAAGCARIKLRNIGTYESPLSLGSPRVDDVAWTRVTTTATVTKTGHGFEVNDTIYVVVSSDVAAITVAAKTIVSVPDANTLTFACLNAGAASGTICYFGTKCANVFVLATSAAARDVEIKRVYAPHTRTNLYTSDNSSKGVTMENVFSDYLNAPLIAMLNGFFRNVSGTPPLTAQSAVYGVHWFNGYVCDVAANTSGQSWSRSSTTVTVTAPGHSLRTGMVISVTSCSDTAALRLGQYTVTALTSSTFTVTGINAGATSGTLSFRVANGRIGLLMNEKTAETDAAYTIDAGAASFTSAGGLVMPNVNDQITFETLEYILGQGSTFPILEPVMAGGTINNYDLFYRLDRNDGNGFTAQHNLHYKRSGGGGSNGSTTITMTDTTGVEVGDYVWGTNVGPNTKVTEVTNGTTIQVDNPNIGTVSGILRFSQLPSETSLGPDTGIKFRWTIKTNTANASVAITSLYIQTESTVLGRSYQYPLDKNMVTVTGLKAGSEVRAYVGTDPATSVEIDGAETSGTSFTFSHSSGGEAGYIQIHHVDYESITLPYTYEANDVSIPIQQRRDRQYANP